MRDTSIRAKARDLAIGVYATGKLREVSECDDAHRNLAMALVGADRDAATESLVELIRRKVTPAELFAEAYTRAAGRIELHEKKLAELEIRRRRLRDNYDRLKAARAPAHTATRGPADPRIRRKEERRSLARRGFA